MKKFIIKVGNVLAIPIISLATLSLVFNDKIKGLCYIKYIWCILFFMSLIVILSGVLELIDKIKNKWKK